MSHRFLPDKQPQVQFTFRIKKDHASELERFRLWAQKEFGMELSIPEALSYIVNTYIAENKKFQKEKANIHVEDQPETQQQGEAGQSSAQPQY